MEEQGLKVEENDLRIASDPQSLLEVYDFQDLIMWHSTVQDGSVPLHWREIDGYHLC